MVSKPHHGDFVTPLDLIDDLLADLRLIQQMTIPELWKRVLLGRNNPDSLYKILRRSKEQQIRAMNRWDDDEIVRIASAIAHLEEFASLTGHSPVFESYRSEIRHLHDVLYQVQKLAYRKKSGEISAGCNDPKIEQVRQTTRAAMRALNHLKTLFAERIGFGVFGPLLEVTECEMELLQALLELGGDKSFVEFKDVDIRARGKDAKPLDRKVREHLVHRSLLESRQGKGIKLTIFSLMILENAGILAHRPVSLGQCSIGGTLGITYRRAQSRCITPHCNEKVSRDSDRTNRPARAALASPKDC